MRKTAEGGAVGTAQIKSYTYWLNFVAVMAFSYYVVNDLKEGGARHVTVALNLESNALIYLFLIVGGSAAIGWPAGVVSAAYKEHTGLLYVEDRLGYAKSGGSDITFWCGFSAFLGSLFLFAKFIPAGALGWFRPFAVLLLAVVAASLLARVLARIVFTALYGPPEHNAY